MSTDARAAAPAPPALDAAERARLAAVAGHLVPAAHGMPSAAEVVTDERLAFVLGARPDLSEPLRSALRSDLGDDPAARLAALQAADAGLYSSLVFVIVAAYYTDAGVRQRLGYPGQQAIQIDALPPETYQQDGLIDRVLARGPVWKDPATGRRAEPGGHRAVPGGHDADPGGHDADPGGHRAERA